NSVSLICRSSNSVLRGQLTPAPNRVAHEGRNERAVARFARAAARIAGEEGQLITVTSCSLQFTHRSLACQLKSQRQSQRPFLRFLQPLLSEAHSGVQHRRADAAPLAFRTESVRRQFRRLRFPPAPANVRTTSARRVILTEMPS